MIDLTYKKEKMLADIKVTDAVANTCLFDADDPRFISLDEVQLIVERETPAELLPILNTAFERRYASVPSSQLFRDLIYPLKKGVGNAYKRGNCRQNGKKITVEAIATRSGAVITIADEGDGFDFANVLERFENNERYFTYRGSGFDQFQKARSVINYTNGGRSMIIRFLCEREPGRPLPSSERESFGMAGDMTAMKSFLARELAQFQPPDTQLQRCRASVPSSKRNTQWDIAYVLEYSNGRVHKTHEMLLTGRMLSQTAAQTEFNAATQLHQLANTNLKIPQPVAYLDTPALTLFNFPPAQNLRRHLRDTPTFDDVTPLHRQIAAGLKSIHQSAIKLVHTTEMSDVLLQQQRNGHQIVQKLAGINPQLANRAEYFCTTVVNQARVLPAFDLTPIHNELGWHSIFLHDGDLYFHFFEHSCYGHPGFDVGSYLADLARFYLLRKEADHYQYNAARQAFLDTYFGNNPPPWHNNLQFFIGVTMLKRLDRLLKRPQAKWEPKIDRFLTLCEQFFEPTKSQENYFANP